MYDEATLRKIANWEAIPPGSEDAAKAAAKVFVQAVSSAPGVAAFANEGSYENFIPAYVYQPAGVVRQMQADGYRRSNYDCLVFYFSYLVPLVAFGNGSWSESIEPSGRVFARGYTGLDESSLLEIGQLRDGPLKAIIQAAISQSSYSVATPTLLLSPAPCWFEPRQRSEGTRPWNRIFHLLFQFCD